MQVGVALINFSHAKLILLELSSSISEEVRLLKNRALRLTVWVFWSQNVKVSSFLHQPHSPAIQYIIDISSTSICNWGCLLCARLILAACFDSAQGSSQYSLLAFSLPEYKTLNSGRRIFTCPKSPNYQYKSVITGANVNEQIFAKEN